jgi:hypothetical protein
MMCKKEKENQNDGGLILLQNIIQMRKKINKDSNKIEKKNMVLIRMFEGDP